MNQIIKKVLSFVFFTFLIFVLLTNPILVVSSVEESINIFINTLLPSLLPFFILSDVLINYNYLYFLERIFRFKYMNILLLTMISGLPSNAKYISTLLSKNIISKEDAEKLLSFSFFPNPMFVISSLGIYMLSSFKAGISILIIIYLSNYLLYIYYYKSLKKVKFDITNESRNFSTLLRSSIIKNVENLIVILGTVVVFNTLSNILIQYSNFSEVFTAILNGFLEMTSGVKRISTLHIDSTLMYSLVTSVVSFSGVSVLMQAFSMIDDKSLNIKFIIKNKIIICLFSFILSYAYFSLFF